LTSTTRNGSLKIGILQKMPFSQQQQQQQQRLLFSSFTTFSKFVLIFETERAS
jgi:hypothetical protein